MDSIFHEWMFRQHFSKPDTYGINSYSGPEKESRTYVELKTTNCEKHDSAG